MRRSWLVDLTPGEVRVLAEISVCGTYKATAVSLGLSPETIRTMSKAARRKLGARNTAHAVALAIRAGLI